MKLQSIAAIACLSLAACGGGGDEGLPVEPITLDPLEPFVLPSGPAGYVALTQELVDVYENLPAFVVTDLPDAGSAQYDGAAIVITDGLDGGFLGDFNAIVSFGNGQFTGSASQFYYDSNENTSVAGTGVLVPGTLSFDETRALRDSFEVAVDGSINGNSVNGEGVVFFLGRDAESIIGAFGATTLVPDDTLITIVGEK